MIESDAEFKERSEDFDSIWLLRRIKAIMAGVNEQKNKCVLMRTHIIYFLSIKQWGTETIYKYHKRFMTSYENVVMHGGEFCLCFDRLLEIKDKDEEGDADKKAIALDKAKKSCLETALTNDHTHHFSSFFSFLYISLH